MRRPRGVSIRRLLALGLAGLAAGVPALAFLFAWSGVYDVAASSGHWAIVDRFLRFGMEQSVKRRAVEAPPPDLADADRVRLGAAHFHGGCASCHGAPGIAVDPTAAQMLPPPPDLAERVGRWRDPELFRLVMHGIKYTGMPAWPARSRDDEAWTVVAFLKQLPGMDAARYRALAIGPATVATGSARTIATRGAEGDAVGACARCHGAGADGPVSRFVPRLHGQSEAFLVRALREYADGSRDSGIMQPVAAALDGEAIAGLAAYYARLAPPPGLASASGTGDARRLAEEGDAAARIPACLPCHGREARPDYPRLAGQPAAYLAGQLRTWKRGPKGRSDADAIMAPIARRLDDAQIEALSAFFEGMAER